jgi:UDP-N-acetylenolpyruvoylglucosamine reductase
MPMPAFSLASLCNFAKEHSFTALNSPTESPGSVGGGVYMNAGAYGGEMKDVLIAAEHLNADGSAGSFESQELMMSYAAAPIRTAAESSRVPIFGCKRAIRPKSERGWRN